MQFTKDIKVLTQLKDSPFLTAEVKETIERVLSKMKLPEEKKQRRSFKQSMYKYN